MNSEMAWGMHLVISGRVQGVGYRAWLVARAEAGGLSGWVRNRSDGTVEAFLAGNDHAIVAILSDARRGPAAAQVTAVEARHVDRDPEGLQHTTGIIVLSTV